MPELDVAGLLVDEGVSSNRLARNELGHVLLYSASKPAHQWRSTRLKRVKLSNGEVFDNLNSSDFHIYGMKIKTGSGLVEDKTLLEVWILYYDTQYIFTEIIIEDQPPLVDTVKGAVKAPVSSCAIQ